MRGKTKTVTLHISQRQTAVIQFASSSQTAPREKAVPRHNKWGEMVRFIQVNNFLGEYLRDLAQQFSVYICVIFTEIRKRWMQMSRHQPAQQTQKTTTAVHSWGTIGFQCCIVKFYD